jgi:hypothetical protein
MGKKDILRSQFTGSNSQSQVYFENRVKDQILAFLIKVAGVLADPTAVC